MKARIREFFTPAFLATAIPATAALAQVPRETQTPLSARPSAETLARLHMVHGLRTSYEGE